jgi:putative ABC transport system ATP-binding protein
MDRLSGEGSRLRAELVKVNVTYRSGEASVHALRDVSTRIKAGDSVSIIGPSGSGKTTLMYVLGLVERPTSGEVLIDGKSHARSSDWALSKIRLRRIGFIFQQFFLLPNLTALENVMLPMRESGLGRVRSRKRAHELLKDVGVDGRSKHLPGRMSGGEQQRVAIARALANDPEMILADEPTGELDSENSLYIMDILTKLNKEKDMALVVVTHDPEVARKGRRTLRMKDGRLIV